MPFKKKQPLVCSQLQLSFDIFIRAHTYNFIYQYKKLISKQSFCKENLGVSPFRLYV